MISTDKGIGDPWSLVLRLRLVRCWPGASAGVVVEPELARRGGGRRGRGRAGHWLRRATGLRARQLHPEPGQRCDHLAFTGARIGSQPAETRAQKIVATSFFLLSPYIAVAAMSQLIAGDPPEGSWVGVGLAVVGIVLMPVLGRAKRRLGTTAGSAATAGEGSQHLLCAALSATILAAWSSMPRSGSGGRTPWPHCSSPPPRSSPEAGPGAVAAVSSTRQGCPVQVAAMKRDGRHSISSRPRARRPSCSACRTRTPRWCPGRGYGCGSRRGRRP